MLDRRLIRRVRGVRVLLGVDAALGVLAALLVLTQAFLLAHVAARAFHGARLADLVVPLALFAAAAAGRAAASWGFEVAGRRAATNVISELRLELVGRRLRDQPAALDRVSSAEVATLAVTGVDALETTFAKYLPQAVLALLVPFAVLVLVAAIDPLSAGVMLLTLPLVPVFMWLIGRYTERRARERWRALSILATHFLDVVRGLPTLRAFNRSEAQAERIEAVGDEYRRTTMETLRVAFLSSTVLELAATVGIALVAVTVGVRLVGGGIGFEAALVVLVLAPELYLPLRNLAAQFHASADGLAVAERLLDVVDAPVAGSSPRLQPFDCVASFERVSFSYPARDRPVLQGVDLELAQRETLALVGPSGAGKSTVASLLLGLVAPDDGAVSVGKPIAWVPQEPTLFRGSVAYNIRLAAPDADDARVRAAARLAGAHEFIRALPEGYETRVGDGGRRLSAGERQRIALARAFLCDAELMILDEPTANLDAESVALVCEAVEQLHRERAILLITHDRTLAALADRVAWLVHGRVRESAEEVV